MNRVSASARPLLLLVAIASLSLVVGVALAFAGKSPQSVIGATGTTGGLFDEPTDVAVKQSTGQIYVADTGNNRIQRLDSDGDFEIAFGRDVIETGAGGDLGDVHEVCSSAADCKPGGSGGPAIGGQLDVPQKLSINQSTGDVYVLANQRITQFDANGDFIRTWGGGVVQSGGTGNVPTNEEKTFSFMGSEAGGSGVDEGTFTLTFEGQTTGPIAWDADAATVQAALVALSNVAPGDVTVTRPAEPGLDWTVTFAGAYAQTPVSLSGSGSGLCWAFGCSGFNIPVETTMAAGGFEICTVASQCQAGTNYGTGAGQIAALSDNGPGDLAVGPNGHVFLADTRNGRVQEFEGDGDFVRAWGRGVDTSQGWGFNIDANQFEICTVASRCQAGRGPDIALGGFGFVLKQLKNGQFANGDINGHSYTTGQEPRAIAVDAAGIVYATNGDITPGSSTGVGPVNPRIERFDSTKATSAELLLPNPVRSENTPSPNTPGPLPKTFAAGLEVDPSSGNLYYLTKNDSGAGTGVADLGIFEIAPGPHPGSRVDIHMPGYGARGLGYDDGSDRLYASTASGGDRLVVVADPPPANPVVSMDPPAVVEGVTEATFSGEVTPGGPAGLTTSYRFEYKRSKDTDWTHLPASMINLGDGNLPVEVSQEATALQFGVIYEVRLRAVREFGAGSTVSAIEQFKVGDIPPTAETLFPQRRTDTEATLSGLVNPQNLETAYYFEYGTDAGYGQTAPVPTGVIEEAKATDSPQPVSADIAGLTPNTTYHYRVVADNGEEVSPGDTTVEGGDVEFTTRAAIDAVQPKRPFEMVTPPFKVVRGAVSSGGGPGLNANTALPSLNGERLHWTSPFFPLTDDVGAPLSGDQRQLQRKAGLGWVEETLNTLQLIPGQNPLFVALHGIATSGDLLTTPLNTQSGSIDPPTGGLLPTEGTNPNRLYTRRLGTGVEGYTPWLTNPDEQYTGLPDPGDDNGGMGSYASPDDAALVNDDGTAMVRWGLYFGLAEDPGTVGDDDPTDDLGLQRKYTIYQQRAADPDELPLAPKDLVNECTSSEGVETQIPNRVGTGVSADTIGSQGCGEGELPSTFGAVVGANTSMANDGGRVFFQTPQPGVGLIPAGCTTATGPATLCQPQLFVRQHSSDGQTATVRWISRSRSTDLGDGRFGGSMITGQRVAELGAGVTFQGASRSGDTVYFMTNSPLVPTDPNGGSSIKTAAASNNSWDLYRYELPVDRNEDPDEGTLTRISAGPTDGADPSTNPGEGSGTPLSFLSDDGKRAYFLTSSPIAGADATPPTDGDTVPGGVVANNSVRNLYLFDDNETGGDRYTFLGQLQISGGECGVFYQMSGSLDGRISNNNNCFRGTPDGSHLVISTTSQLTSDDNDSAADVYLYDAVADSLTRLSAPPAGAVSYLCSDQFGTQCNADLGWRPFGGGFSGSTSGGPDSARGFGGMRYMNISEDGSGEISVFFESRAELLPSDSNGDHWDVYEWHDGELFLLSRALPGHHSWFSGNSVSGRDAFIWTSDRIDPREIDDFDYDLYDARIGGGFPYTPPPVPCDVLALECEDEAIEGPNTRSPQTLASGRPGNLPGKACAKLAGNARKASRNAKRFRGAAKRAKNPRAKRRLGDLARRAARNAKRTSKGAKRCRRARGKGEAKPNRQANRNRGGRR